MKKRLRQPKVSERRYSGGQRGPGRRGPNPGGRKMGATSKAHGFQQVSVAPRGDVRLLAKKEDS